MKNKIAFAWLMGIITTGIISFALIYLNLGFGGLFLKIWLRSWGMAYLVVIPVILLLAPKLQALVAKRFRSMKGPDVGSSGNSALLQKIAFALIMGAITTGVISFTLISVNLGFRENFVHIWARSWGYGYMVVIPALLIVAPRVQSLVDKMFSAKPAS